MRTLQVIVAAALALSACASIDITTLDPGDGLVAAAADGPQRAKICTWTTRRVGDKCVTETHCEPVIAEGQGAVPTKTAAAPAAVASARAVTDPAHSRKAYARAEAAQSVKSVAAPITLHLTPPPQCVGVEPMQMIQPTSRNCWVSDEQYCVKPSPGKTGFSCSCRALSGYYG